MIFYAEDPRSKDAQIIDVSGENICDHYPVKWYNTETQTACIYEVSSTTKDRFTIKRDGLGGFAYNIIHLPGSKLVFK